LLQHRVVFSPQYEVEHLATVTAMVAAGLGVAALPELAAAMSPHEGVVQRPLTDPDLRRPIGLITRRGRSLSPAGAAMVELLREELQQTASQV
jgi:LysR family transcriptional regulator, carnitine catabolism transcriptional activator